MLNAGWKGELALGAIEGSIWGELRLTDVRLRHQERDVLAVPEVGLGYELLPLLEGRVVVSEIRLSRPVVELVQQEGGAWNLLDALATREVAPSVEPAEPGSLVIVLESVAIEEGTIVVTPTGQPTLRLAELALDTGAEILPAGITADVRKLRFRLEAPDLPAVRVDAALAYLAAEAPNRVEIRSLSLATEESKVTLEGMVQGLEAIAADRARVEIATTLAVERISGNDLRRFVPDWRAEESVSGRLTLAGPLSALVADLGVEVAGGKLDAEAQADVAADTPSYGIKATLAGLDLTRVPSGAGGVIDAALDARGSGTAVESLAGTAHLEGTGLAYAGAHIENLRFDATAEGTRVRFDGEARDREGRADLEGEVALGEMPTYRLALATERWNLQSAMPDGVATDLNLKAAVSGSSFDLATLRGEAKLLVSRSVVRDLTIERAELAAKVADGRLAIDALDLAANGSRVTATGALGLQRGRNGTLRYDVDVPELTPWLALAGQKGRGKLTLRGDVRGEPSRLAFQGKLALEAVCLSSVDLRRAELDFDGERVEGDAGAVVDVALTASAAQTERRMVRLRTQVSVAPAAVRATMAELALAIEGERWQLDGPATFVQDRQGLAVRGFRVRGGASTLTLEAALPPRGEQDLRLALTDLPLASLKPLLPPGLAVEGAVGAEIQVAGTAAAPRIVAHAEVADLRVGEQRYPRLALDLGYEQGGASTSFEFRQDESHALQASARLPMEIRWDAGFVAEPRGELDLRAQSSGLSIAVLNLLGKRVVRNAAGELLLDVTVKGPLEALRPSGSFALRDARLEPAALGTALEALAVEGTLAAERVAISRIHVVSGEGMLEGNVDVALRGFAPGAVRAEIRARKFTAISTHEYRAVISGEVSAEGPLAGPSVRGSLVVDEATLKPDLEFLSKSPPARDETIRIVPIAQMAPPSPDDCAGAPPHPTEAAVAQAEAAAPGADVDVSVSIPHNTWAKHPNATVELQGSVRATRKAGGDLAVVGVIETVRGWAEFQGKRFRVARGVIRLTGGKEIDPSLDIVAEHTVEDWTVEAVVGGTASSPSLELRSDPYLEQADILSVLIFGRPASQLSEGEEQTLSERASSIATSFAITQIGQAVVKALGLEEMGVQIGEVSSERVALGKYVSEKTFVSIAQNLGDEQSQEVAIEYRFLPDWAFVTSTRSTGENAADVIWRKQY